MSKEDADNQRVHFIASRELLRKLDKWRGGLPDVPNRSEALRRALEEFLASKDAALE